MTRLDQLYSVIVSLMYKYKFIAYLLVNCMFNFTGGSLAKVMKNCKISYLYIMIPKQMRLTYAINILYFTFIGKRVK